MNEMTMKTDGAAETIVSSLQLYIDMEGKKPTFQELIDAARAILWSNADDVLADPERMDNHLLEAVFEPPAPALVSERDVETNPLMFTLAGAFGEISEQFQQLELARKPKLAEVLGALAFVFGANPERLLAGAEGLKLKELRVKP
jgi:hypothetical protein